MRLKITEDGGEPRIVELPRGEVSVGRSARNDIVLALDFISGQHLRIHDGLLVKDLESRNGTFLDGERINSPSLIAGRRLTVGGSDLELEVLHSSDEGMAAVLAAQVAEMRARLESLKPEAGPVPVRPSADRSDYLDRLVRDDYMEAGLPPSPSVADVYLYESFKFVRNSEKIVSRLAQDLTKRLDLKTRLPDSEDNFRLLMDELFVNEGSPKAHQDLAEYLDKVLGWLFVSMQAYKEAGITLLDETKRLVQAKALEDLKPIPWHMRVLGLENLVLWQRAQETLDDLSPNYVIDRLDRLAQVAAQKVQKDID